MTTTPDTANIDTAIALMSRDSLSMFGWNCTPWYQTPKHVMIMCDFLQRLERREFDRAQIWMPPRHSKSASATINFIAWYLGRNPTHKVMLVCHTSHLSKKFGRWIRNMMHSPNFREIFPECEISKDSDAAEYFTTTQGGEFLATTAASGSGTGSGANCLVLDDVFKDREQVFSQLQRETIHEYYRSVALTRLQPGGIVLITNTRWSDADLSGWLLDKTEQEQVEDWQILNFPAIATDDQYYRGQLWRKRGEALWPEMWPLPALNRIKAAKGQWDWFAQYQQTPSAIEGVYFLRKWIKYYDWNPHLIAQPDYIQIITQPFRIWQSWDTAMKQGQENDYSACVTVMDTPSGIYVLDVWRDKVIAPELFKTAKQLAQYWHASKILVEDAQSGTGLIQQMQVHTGLNVVAIRPQAEGSKIVRAQASSPFWQSGRMHLPRQAPWKKDFEDELVCLEKNTEITTIMGNKPICEVQPGEQVMTRLGWKHVLKAGCTGRGELCEILFSNNRSIRATRNHQIFVPNYGFKNAEALKAGELLLLYIGGSNSACMKASDTLQPRGFAVNTKNSIDIFTSKKWAPSLRGITSIIKTKIQQITRFPIWKPFLHPSIMPNTINVKELALKKDVVTKDVPLSAKPVEPCFKGRRGADIASLCSVLKNVAIKPIQTGLQDIRSGVRLAAKYTRAGKHQNTVQGNARVEDTGENRANAPVVIPYLSQRLKELGFVPNAVRVVEVRPVAGRHDVYNLEIQDIPEFVANGILVHNSFPTGAHDDQVDAQSQLLIEFTHDQERNQVFETAEPDFEQSNFNLFNL